MSSRQCLRKDPGPLGKFGSIRGESNVLHYYSGRIHISILSVFDFLLVLMDLLRTSSVLRPRTVLCVVEIQVVTVK